MKLSQLQGWAISVTALFLIYLHYQVLPFAVWRTPSGLVYNGWEVLLFAWPVWSTTGLLSALCGLWLGTTAVERDALADAEKARAAEALARHEAADAIDRANRTVSQKRDELNAELRYTKEMQADALAAIGNRDQLQNQLLDLKAELDYSKKRFANLQKGASPRRKKSSGSFLPFK